MALYFNNAIHWDTDPDSSHYTNSSNETGTKSFNNWWATLKNTDVLINSIKKERNAFAFSNLNVINIPQNVNKSLYGNKIILDVSELLCPVVLGWISVIRLFTDTLLSWKSISLLGSWCIWFLLQKRLLLATKKKSCIVSLLQELLNSAVSVGLYRDHLYYSHATFTGTRDAQYIYLTISIWANTIFNTINMGPLILLQYFPLVYLYAWFQMKHVILYIYKQFIQNNWHGWAS